MTASSSLWAALNRRVTARVPVSMQRNHSAVALASISFDDFPRSAWTTGGEILRRHNVLATYYVVGGFQGRVVEGVEQYTIDDLKAVAAAGHEIASHTYGHRPVSDLKNADIVEDENQNTEFFKAHLDTYSAHGFAYPYGEISVRTKRLYSRLYTVSRGIREGVNGRWFDRSQVKAIGLERKSWSKARIESAVAQAREKKAWIVLFTHDVSETPSPYGATPEMLEHAIETFKSSGIEVVTMREAYERTQLKAAGAA